MSATDKFKEVKLAPTLDDMPYGVTDGMDWEVYWDIALGCFVFGAVKDNKVWAVKVKDRDPRSEPGYVDYLLNKAKEAFATHG